MSEIEQDQGRIDHFKLLRTSSGDALILTGRIYTADGIGFESPQSFVVYSPGTLDPNSLAEVLGPADQKRAEAIRLAEEHGVEFHDSTDAISSEA